MTAQQLRRLPRSRWSFSRAQRNREREDRARTLLALYPDPAAVQLDELPTQGQPEPRALYLLRRRAHLLELLEDLLLILRGDADPSVADRYLHESVPWHRTDINAPTLRRELDRIRQEVQDDLTELSLVCLNLAQPVIDVGMQCD